MSVWSTSEIKRDGQTDWLVRLYEKTVHAVRELGGAPSDSWSAMSIQIPNLDAQAAVMRCRDQLPPGHNPPTGVLDWLE